MAAITYAYSSLHIKIICTHAKNWDFKVPFRGNFNGSDDDLVLVFSSCLQFNRQRFVEKPFALTIWYDGTKNRLQLNQPFLI